MGKMSKSRKTKPLVPGLKTRGSDRAYRTYLIRYLGDTEYWVHKNGHNLGTYKTENSAKKAIDYLID